MALQTNSVVTSVTVDDANALLLNAERSRIGQASALNNPTSPKRKEAFGNTLKTLLLTRFN